MLRELLRPWKLFTFAVGMAWLLYGATHYNIPDWDVGISVIMGLLTYITSPMAVRILLSMQFKRYPLALFCLGYGRWKLLAVSHAGRKPDVSGSQFLRI